ncbi:MAG: biotin--[acetyl-CoA-carboxylase] ligase [Chitinophagaceae bacterium]
MPYAPSQAGIGRPFIELQTVDSTNNYALDRVHAGLAQHGTAFFAHQQVAGKGQRGKTWNAPRHSSLILSVVIDPGPLPYTSQFQLSACIAVSACEFFTAYAGDASCIKWPNDLYWQDRKAGGILIENILGGAKRTDDSIRMKDERPSSVIHHPSSSWQWAIAGIGINLNQPSFAQELKNPVSLRQITGRESDPVSMAKELCTVIDKNFYQLISEGFDPLYARYQAHLYKREQPVRFKKGARVFEATVKGVLPDGRLLVQHATEEEFASGEVEWLIPGKPAAG